MISFTVEILIVAFSFGLFITYHIWFFCIHGTGLRTTKLHTRDGRYDLFHKGNVARIQFTEMVCREDSTIDVRIPICIPAALSAF
jgi:hypothetical protein